MDGVGRRLPQVVEGVQVARIETCFLPPPLEERHALGQIGPSAKPLHLLVLYGVGLVEPLRLEVLGRGRIQTGYGAVVDGLERPPYSLRHRFSAPLSRGSAPCPRRSPSGRTSQGIDRTLSACPR